MWFPPDILKWGEINRRGKEGERGEVTSFESLDLAVPAFRPAPTF